MHLLNIEPQTVFQSLSDPTRLRILRLLAITKSEACLCDIAESLDEPEYKLSRHLKVLRQAGLLAAEKEGRWIYHKTLNSSQHLKSLFSFICQIPDTHGQFQQDLKLFTKRKKIFSGGRCKTESKVLKNKVSKKKVSV